MWLLGWRGGSVCKGLSRIRNPCQEAGCAAAGAEEVKMAEIHNCQDTESASVQPQMNV